MTLPSGLDTLEAEIRELEFLNHLNLAPDDPQRAELEERCSREPRLATKMAGVRRLIADLRALRGTPEAARLNALGDFVFNGTDEDAKHEVRCRWHDHIQNFSHSLLAIGYRPPTARQYLQEMIAIVYDAVPAARRLRPEDYR